MVAFFEPDIRDEILSYVRAMEEKTEIRTTTLLNWLGITKSKYYNWLRVAFDCQ